MPVPTAIADLSTTAALNSPDGSIDIPSSLDDYQRAHGAFIAKLRDEKAALASPTFTGTVGGITAAMVANTPAGTIAATTIQGAINEIVSDLSASSGAALVAGIAAGAGAVARTVQSQLRDNVHIKGYGGVCDGVADDTAAFNAAMAAVAVGGTIFISGTPKITSKITLAKKLKLAFDGAIGTNINSLPGSYFIKAGAMTTSAFDITMPGVIWDGGGLLCQAGNTGDGVVILAQNVRMNSPYVSNAGGDGIRIGADTGVVANAFYLDNPTCVYNGRYGIHISDQTAPTLPNANAGTLITPRCNNNASHGLYINNARMNTFVGTWTEANTGDGVHLALNANNNTFIGGDSEANVTTHSINIEAGATDNFFFNFVLGDGDIVNAGTGTRFFDKDGLRVGNVSKPGATALDWYEEGTFTPSVTFVTPGNLAVTYAANGQVGSYTRIGNRVTCNLYIETATFTHSTATGVLKILGLPYVSKNSANLFSVGSCIYQGITDATRPHVSARVDNGANFLYLAGSGSGAALALESPAMIPSGSALALIISITYEVPT